MSGPTSRLPPFGGSPAIVDAKKPAGFFVVTEEHWDWWRVLGECVASKRFRKDESLSFWEVEWVSGEEGTHITKVPKVLLEDPPKNIGVIRKPKRFDHALQKRGIILTHHFWDRVRDRGLRLDMSELESNTLRIHAMLQDRPRMVLGMTGGNLILVLSKDRLITAATALPRGEKKPDLYVGVGDRKAPRPRRKVNKKRLGIGRNHYDKREKKPHWEPEWDEEDWL